MIRSLETVSSTLIVLTILMTYPQVAWAMNEPNMGMKLEDRKFIKGALNARTSNNFKKGSKVVLGIPGGPGIPGYYMDQITIDLATKIGAVPVVIDLPNHGSSKRLKFDQPMTYVEAKIILLDFLRELSDLECTVVLFGHSLGALIALDLLSSQTVFINKVILVGMPVEFERNPAFTKFLSDSGVPAFLDESGFAIWWRAVLPAYFYQPPTRREIELLAHSTSWFANEQFTVGLPSAGTIASVLKPELMKDIIYFEGEKEIILPHDNFKRIGDAFPTVPKSIIAETGHFLMLENSQSFLNEVTRHLDICSELLVSPASINNK